MPSRSPIQVNYGPMAKFHRSIVACRYCVHHETETGWCPKMQERKGPAERCIPHFERLVGSDDA